MYINETGLARVTENIKAKIDYELANVPSIISITGYNVESVDNGDGTQTLEITNGDAAITSMNIAAYKAQDMANIVMNGGTIGNNADYAAAEAALQIIYKEIMEGSDNE